jgi:hypothetical protein
MMRKRSKLRLLPELFCLISFLFLFFLLVIIFVSSVSPAYSAELPGRWCLKRDLAVETIVDGYREKLAGIGVDVTDQLLEIYVNPVNDDWSILLSSPEGFSCLVLYGAGLSLISNKSMIMKHKGDPP